MSGAQAARAAGGAQATRAASGAQATRSEVCAVALADALRGSGERLVSCFGLAPQVGARVAKRSFEPDLLLTDGICSLLAKAQPISGPARPAARMRRNRWWKAGCLSAASSICCGMDSAMW